MGEKKSKCRDSEADGNSEAGTANVVTICHSSGRTAGAAWQLRASQIILPLLPCFVDQCAGVEVYRRETSVQEWDQCAGVEVYRSENRIKTVVSGLG